MNREIKIIPAFTENAKGRDVREGWDVIIGTEWDNRFATKREAKAYVQKKVDRERAEADMIARRAGTKGIRLG